MFQASADHDMAGRGIGVGRPHTKRPLLQALISFHVWNVTLVAFFGNEVRYFSAK